MIIREELFNLFEINPRFFPEEREKISIKPSINIKINHPQNDQKNPIFIHK